MGALKNFREGLLAGGIAKALRHKQYAIYAAGSVCSGLGVWVQRIALAWLTWELTHSYSWLGGIVLAHSLPSFFVMPIAGALADRYNRIKLLRLTELLNGTLVSILALVTILGLVTIELVLAFSLARGIAGYIGVPARSTIAPTLVPKEDLSAAIAVNAIVNNSGAFIGPALAGVIIARAGVGWALAFSGLGMFVTYVVLGFVKPLRDEHRAGGSGGGIFADILEGVRYIVGHAGIGPLLIAAFAAAILVRPLTDLLAGITDVVFKLDEAAFASFMTAFGIGGMLGSIWIANRNRLAGTLNIFLTGTMASILLTLAFTVTPVFAVAVVLVFLLGLSGSTIINASQILIQSAVEGSVRARVMGLYALSIRVAPAIGAMAMGGLADLMGFSLPVAAGALLFLLAWLWLFAIRGPLLMHLEDEPATAPAAAGGAAGSKPAE